MPVIGKNSYLISRMGRTASVQPYGPNYEPVDVPLVHVALQYECPYSGTIYVLVVRNALYVLTMTNNLIPPFIIREVGIIVNDVPKIHVDDPTNSDHVIIFKDTDFKIPMLLWGTFSYFSTSKPSHDAMIN